MENKDWVNDDSQQGKAPRGGEAYGWGPSPSTNVPTTPISSRSARGEGVIRGPEYYNPDPLARLIGPSNEATIEVEGQEVKALLDTGANMSCITKQFTEELGLEIHSINKMIDIEGTGGGIVPYFGYVECRLNIPEIEAFDKDVLMLVINNSPYGARVPIQLGTFALRYGNASCHGPRKLNGLNRQWRRAEFSTRLGSHQFQATDSEPSDSIDLEHVHRNGPIKRQTGLETL